jgi:putative peptidoglycan lipid II flippase
MNLRKIFGASFLLALSSFLSRLLGVFRDHLLAKSFGAGVDLDVYYAAFRIPDLLYAFLIMSSISVVFLPLFQDFKAKKDYDSAWHFPSLTNIKQTCFLSLRKFTFFLA